MRIPSIFLFFFLCYSNFAFGAQEESPENLLVSENMKIISMIDEQGQSLINVNPIVSQTLKNKDQLIFCNYKNLYLMDLNTGESKILKKPENVNAWVPTGVKWCADNQYLYVANYGGHDILILQFNDNDQLVLVKRIADEELVSPENIDVIDNGRIFVVADYDGNKVILFNESSKLWSREVGNAHGVSFSKDGKFIYASGLAKAILYKFDLEGNLIKETGTFGWKENGYLWPTSIAVTDKNIFISDAHTGKITFTDDDLNSQKSIGGNGLGLTLFNMPYGVSITNDDLLFVSDTFKDRILKIDPYKNQIISIYEAGIKESIIPELNKESKAIWSSQEPLGLHYQGRVNISQKVDITFNEFGLNTAWNPGYDSFHDNLKVLYLDKTLGLFSTSFYYWMLAKNFKYQDHTFTIIGSPEAADWLLIYKGIVFPVRVGMDFWIKDNSLVSSRGQILPFETLASIGLEKIEAYIQSLKNGTKPLDAIADLLKIPDFLSKLPSFVTSTKGKEFIENLLNAKTAKEQQKVAKSFLKNAEQDSKIYFCEVAIASMAVYGFTEESFFKNFFKPLFK